ncbi:MAG: SGNH/GDSL hydrolase family protein [Ruthenibacterium sp.]
MKKNILKTAVFALIFVLLFAGAEKLLRGKWLGKNITGTLEAYAAAAPNSVDVLFVGSSNAFAAINPLQLWQESGITSFVLASAWQQVPASAYLLEEALKTQTPRLVCFEVRSTAYDSHTDEDKIHQLIDGRPLTPDKWRDAQSMKWDSDSMLYLMSPLLRFHSRWKTLEKQDFDYFWNRPTGGYNAKGYYAAYHKALGQFDSYNDPITTKERSMRAENVAALDRIVAMCEEKGIDLLFWKTPTEEWRKGYSDTVQAYADAHDIPFLDTNPLMEEIGLDKSQDFNDASHFNVWGGRKFTDYMNGYLQQNYSLPDRRQDAAIAAQWNDDADAYVRTTIAECDDMQEYFARLADENTVAVIAFTAQGDNVNRRSTHKTASAALAQYGLDSFMDPKITPHGHACLAVLEGGTLRFVSNEASAQSITFTAGGTSITAHVSADVPDTQVKVDYSLVFSGNEPGVSVVVYDKQIGATLDAVTFDVYAADCAATHVR